MKEKTYHIFMILMMVLILASVFSMFFISEHHVITIVIFTVQLLLIIVYSYFVYKNENHFDRIHKQIEEQTENDRAMRIGEYKIMKPRNRFFGMEMGKTRGGGDYSNFSFSEREDLGPSEYVNNPREGNVRYFSGQNHIDPPPLNEQNLILESRNRSRQLTGDIPPSSIQRKTKFNPMSVYASDPRNMFGLSPEQQYKAERFQEQSRRYPVMG